MSSTEAVEIKWSYVQIGWLDQWNKKGEAF